jgi:hypothetical protein
LTDNSLVSWVPCRSSAALLALVLACVLLVGSGTASAAGSNGSNGSNGSSAANGSAGSNGSSGANGGQSVTAPSSGSGPLSGGLSTPGTPTPTATATQTQTQATTANTATGGGGSLSQTSVFGIVIGSVIVIGGVCVYIFRDASRRAPSRRRADGGSATQTRVPGSKRVKPRKLSAQERKRRKRGRAPRRK